MGDVGARGCGKSYLDVQAGGAVFRELSSDTCTVVTFKALFVPTQILTTPVLSPLCVFKEQGMVLKKSSALNVSFLNGHQTY